MRKFLILKIPVCFLEVLWREKKEKDKKKKKKKLACMEHTQSQRTNKSNDLKKKISDTWREASIDESI
jgi:hypothetical protein